MIVELFSRRPFTKILFSHLTILISRFRITICFTENFTEISQKISQKFTKIPNPPPIHTPCHSLTPTYHIPAPPQNFKSVFLEMTIIIKVPGFYLPVSYILVCVSIKGFKGEEKRKSDVC